MKLYLIFALCLGPVVGTLGRENQTKTRKSYICETAAREGSIGLELESTSYLPYAYNVTGLFSYNKNAVLKTAYVVNNKKLVTVGSNLIHVLDISNVVTPKVTFHTELQKGTATSVAACRNYVAVTFDNDRFPLDGRVLIYRFYHDNVIERSYLEKLHEVSVGKGPSSLKFTSNCQKIVVTVEGQLTVVGSEIVNPEGLVAIIDWPTPNLADPYTLLFVNFKQFNSRAEEYVKKGVRWVYRSAIHPSTFSQDLQPHSVELNKLETLAYILLPDNNALAVLDLTENVIKELYSFGAKDWTTTRFDSSDKDDGINLKSRNISALYQPTEGRVIHIRGLDHMFVASTGRDRTYTRDQFPFGWTEVKRGQDFVNEGLLSDTVSAELRRQLQDPSELGHLQFTTIGGQTNGSYEHLYTLGGRSFSNVRLPDLTQVFDSGQDIEERIAKAYSSVFNSDPMFGDFTPIEKMDTRSPVKGPEPSAIELGKLYDRNLIFVASAQPGFTMIYSTDLTGTEIPRFESILYAGYDQGTWKEMYEDGISWDVGPKGLLYISGDDSPTEYPLLVVSSSVSGTVSIYTIEEFLSKRCHPTHGVRLYDHLNLTPDLFHYFHQEVGAGIAISPILLAVIVVFGVFGLLALVTLTLTYLRDRKARLDREKGAASTTTSSTVLVPDKY